MRKYCHIIAACAEEEVKCSTVVPLLFLRKRDCATGSEVGGLEHTHRKCSLNCLDESLNGPLHRFFMYLRIRENGLRKKAICSFGNL